MQKKHARSTIRISKLWGGKCYSASITENRTTVGVQATYYNVEEGDISRSASTVHRVIVLEVNSD